MCERELETEQNCNILTPHSYGHNSVSFPLSWATQPGAWGLSLSGTCSSSQHLLSNWLTSCLHPGYIIIWHPLGQGYNILIFLDRMHLLFTPVHFLYWQLPGSEVNIQHIPPVTFPHILESVPKEPYTITNTVFFMYHSCLSTLARCKYLSSIFSFICLFVCCFFVFVFLLLFYYHSMVRWNVKIPLLTISFLLVNC